MLRQRTFQRGRKLVNWDQVTDLIAVRSPTGGDATAALAAIPALVSAAQLKAYEDAGWKFLPDSAQRAIPGDSLKAKVFVKPDGRVALSTNQLTVQLAEDAFEQRGVDVFGDYSCRVLDQLTFAPRLFRVAVDEQEGRDAVDVANTMVSDGVAVFAEPELLEQIGGR